MHKPKIKIQEKQENHQIFPEDTKITVGIHGTPGSFTEQSLYRFCEEVGIEVVNVDIKYLVEAEKVIEAVISGQIDRGVVAVANSGSGVCTFTLHSLSKHRIEILATYGMQVSQCLLVHPDIKSIDEVKQIFAHPQAIDQCQRTLDDIFAQIEVFPGKDADDTALCARRLAHGELTKSIATLASARAAETYGLKVLQHDMQHDPLNMTTFLIIKK